MSKSRDAFRTISEVAELLETPAHVLRFWETKFTQVKPVKRAGGRRYYRPNDVALLAGIRQLLHDDGLTIKGVQKVLREQGVKHVAAIAPPPGLFDDAEPTPDREALPDAPDAAQDTLPDEREDTAPGANVLPFAQPDPEPAELHATAAPAPAAPDTVAEAEAAPFPEASDPDPQVPPQELPWAEDPQTTAAMAAQPPTADVETDATAEAETPAEPLPEFLTQSLEDRAHQPLDAQAPASPTARPETPAPLPEVADLQSLPAPAPGPLAALAGTLHLSPEQEISARAQLAALRRFVAARGAASAA